MEGEKQIDHLAEAKGHLEVGCEFLDEGRGPHSDRRVLIAGVHAQIAQAEELRKLTTMLGRSSDGNYAEITVDGHVTTGAP